MNIRHKEYLIIICFITIFVIAKLWHYGKAFSDRHPRLLEAPKIVVLLRR